MSQNDIDVLDLRLLRLFDAIHATSSITKAADALDLSQPTVSIGLGKLRRHFGDPLFVRTPDGMLATPLADGLIVAVRDALQALLCTAVRNPSSGAPAFVPARAA